MCSFLLQKTKEHNMNEEQFKGRWNEIKGKVKERWGRLTDNEITEIDGRRDQLLGSIQTKYGIAKERAELELSRFMDSFNSPSYSSKESSSYNAKSEGATRSAYGEKPYANDKTPKTDRPTQSDKGTNSKGHKVGR